MAYIKPGTVIKGYIWTGKRWLKNPERTADKVRVKKEIDQSYEARTKTTQNSQMTQTNAMSKYPGGVPRMAKPVTPKPMSAQEKKKAMAEGPKRSVAKPTANQSAAAKANAAKASTVKKTSTSPTKISTPTSKATLPKSPSSKQSAKKMPTVSQSNTMWVKKGDVVNGETVKKGYVAQRGKPERKVNANVKLVVDTARGKAGSKVAYSKGRAAKKGK